MMTILRMPLCQENCISGGLTPDEVSNFPHCLQYIKRQCLGFLFTWRVFWSMTWKREWGLLSKETGRWRRMPLPKATHPGSSSSFRQYTKPLQRRKKKAVFETTQCATTDIFHLIFKTTKCAKYLTENKYITLTFCSWWTRANINFPQQIREEKKLGKRSN